MKKLIMFLLIAGTCTTAAVAQDSTKMAKPEKMEKMHDMKDCVMMKDGKVMVMKGNNVMALDKDLTLANGTTVKNDGSVKMADGTAMQLKEGEAIDMEGKVIIKKGTTPNN